jgi:predicted dehydrogenase
VGYNYRWAPLVQHAKHLIDAGTIGDVVHYRGSFFSVYGADPLGRLSWRYLVDEGLLDRAEGEYWRSGGRVV